MPNITDTILRTAEDLAQLHDVLLFNTEESLKQYAPKVGKAADLLIDDVVYELYKRQFPMISRIKAIAPSENAFELLDSLKSELPVSSPILDLHSQIEDACNKAQSYYHDKSKTIESLLLIPEKTTVYLLSVAANRSA